MEKLSVVGLVAVIFALTAVLALLATGTFAQPGAGEFNTPPTAMPQTVDTDQDTPVEILLVATDPDAGQSLFFKIVVGTIHGLLQDGVTGTDIIAPQPLSGNSVKYIPDSGYQGPDSFEYIVDDGIAGSNTATVSINVVAPPAVELCDVYMYSVKVMCTPHLGKPGTALAPGKYKTGVNVLNPWNKPTHIKKWLTLAPPQGQPSVMGNVIEVMEPRSAFDVG